MKKHSLVRYFTIYSTIAFALTGIVLAFFISNHIKNDKIGNARNVALLTLNSIVKPELSQEDFDTILSDTKANKLNKLILDIRKNSNISDVNILNVQGQIIFSSSDKMTGAFLTPSDMLTNILRNKIDFSVSKHMKSVNASTPSNNFETLRILAPISYDNRVVGAYEVFVPYEEIRMHIGQLNRIILLIVFSGLLVLFYLLMRIIKSASSTLIKQNQELTAKADELQESYNKLNKSYRNTIIALSNAVDARDKYTAGHSERVTGFSLQIAHKLGLEDEKLQLLETAALFHDIGKVGINDDILNKTGKLSEEEFEIIKQHPQIGVNILCSIDFLNEVLPIILHHHERFAGGGYPRGISGEEIPLESRIIAVADTYDAMTSDRPYRKGLPHDIAVSEIVKFKGVQFDETVVDAFISIIDEIKAAAV